MSFNFFLKKTRGEIRFESSDKKPYHNPGKTEIECPKSKYVPNEGKKTNIEKSKSDIQSKKEKVTHKREKYGDPEISPPKLSMPTEFYSKV